MGVNIGYTTDLTMSCERAALYHSEDDMPLRCEPSYGQEMFNYITQAIFTIEVVLKGASDFKNPVNYFRDSWNCLDFFVVTGASKNEN